MPNETTRTDDQARADIFDCDLFRLISRAEVYAEGKGRGSERWGDVARDLRSARARVRGLMHPADVKDTV